MGWLSHVADTAYLIGAPSISDEAAQEIRVRSWPSDEAAVNREIYAACEEIRKRRPRDPVGYVNGEAEIPTGVSFALANPRQRR